MVDYFRNHHRRHCVPPIVQRRGTIDGSKNRWVRADRDRSGRRTRTIHRDIGSFESKDEKNRVGDFRRLHASANPGWTRYVLDAVGRINHRHTRLRSLEMGAR